MSALTGEFVDAAPAPLTGEFVDDKSAQSLTGEFVAGKETPATADDVAARISDISYNPTLAEFKLWHAAQEAKPFSLSEKFDQAVAAGKSMAGTFWHGVKGAAKFVTDPENNDPILTAAEGYVRGSQRDLAMLADAISPDEELIRKSVYASQRGTEFENKNGHWPTTKDFEQFNKDFDTDVLPKFRYDKFMDAREQMREQMREPANISVITGQPAAFNPEVAEAFSTVVSPVTLATLGAGAAPKVGATLLQRGAGAALEGAGKAVSGVAKLVDATAGLPGAAIKKLTGAFTDPATAEAAAKIVESGEVGATKYTPGVPIPVVSTIQKIKYAVNPLNAAADTLKATGRQIAADPTRLKFLDALATDGRNPVWFRKAAGLAASVPLLSESLELGGHALESGVHGAAIGGVIGGLTDGPDGAAAGIGSGAVLGALGGTAGRLIAKDAVLAVKRQADLNAWIAGKTPEELANIAQLKLSPGAALHMATLEAYAKGVRGADGEADVKFHYVNDADFQAAFQGSAKGAELVNSDQPTIVINVDKADSRTLPHEVMHALLDLGGTPEAKAALNNKLFSQFNPATGEVLSEGLFSKEDQQRYFDQYRAKLPDVVGTSSTSSPNSLRAQWDALPLEQKQAKIRGEIVADAFSNLASSNGPDMLVNGLTGVRRRLADHLLQADSSSMLGKLRSALEGAGVKFESSGAPSELFVDKTGKPITNSPQVDAALRDYLRAKQKIVTRLTADDQSPFATVVSRQDMMSKNGRVIAELFKDNDNFAKDKTGNVIIRNGQPVLLDPRAIDKLQKDRTEQMIAALAKVPDTGEAGIVRQKDNGAWEGKHFSDAQLAALDALPPDILSPSLKVKLRQKNEFHRANDGSRYVIDYNAATKEARGGGRVYSSGIKSTLRDVVPISMHISKAGNFYTTALDTTVLFSKLDRWLKDKPRAFDSWKGDRDAFVRDLFKYLDNHANGRSGSIDLDPEPWRAVKKKNVINDLLGTARGTGNNPLELSTSAGKDQLIRSFRFDRTNRITPSGGDKMPFDYYKAKANFLPVNEQDKAAQSRLAQLPKVKLADDLQGKANQLRNEAEALRKEASLLVNGVPWETPRMNPQQAWLKAGGATVRRGLRASQAEIWFNRDWKPITPEILKTTFPTNEFVQKYLKAEELWNQSNATKFWEAEDKAKAAQLDADAEYAAAVRAENGWKNYRLIESGEYKSLLKRALQVVAESRSGRVGHTLAEAGFTRDVARTGSVYFNGGGYSLLRISDHDAGPLGRGVFDLRKGYVIEDARAILKDLESEEKGNAAPVSQSGVEVREPSKALPIVGRSQSESTQPAAAVKPGANFLPLHEAQAVTQDTLHNIQLHRDFLENDAIRKSPAQIKASTDAIKGYQKTLLQASGQRLKALKSVGTTSTSSQMSPSPLEGEGRGEDASHPIPESPDTIAAQLDMVQSGRKPAMLVTPGAVVPEIPPGLSKRVTTAGTFIFDHRKISPLELNEAVKNNTIGDVLGFGVDQKPAPGTETGVVVIRDSAGKEVQAVVVDKDTQAHALEAAQKMARPGDTVAIEPTADKILRDRSAAVPAAAAKPEIKVGWKTLADIPEVKPPPAPDPEVLKHQREQTILDTARRMAHKQAQIKLAEKTRLKLAADYWEALDRQINQGSKRPRWQQLGAVAHAVANTPTDQLDAITQATWTGGLNGAQAQIEQHALHTAVFGKLLGN